MLKRMHFLMTMLLCFFTTSVMAQVTTSGIAGKVVAGDENLIGVTVTAVHEPSGTRYNAVTNADGRYTIQGMRVGGPYTVTFNYIGYKEEAKHNVQLTLGNTEMIDVNLKENARPWARWWSPAKLGVEAMGLPPTSRAPRLRKCPPSTATSMMWLNSRRW